MPSLAISALLLVSISHTADASDWAQWRGPNRDAKSQETGLLDTWPEDGPPLTWKATGVGGGYSSIALANGRIFTMGDLDDGSYVIVLNEADGLPIWQTRIGEAGGHKRYPGPRGTPTIDGGDVFRFKPVRRPCLPGCRKRRNKMVGESCRPIWRENDVRVEVQ